MHLFSVELTILMFQFLHLFGSSLSSFELLLGCPSSHAQSKQKFLINSLATKELKHFDCIQFFHPKFILLLEEKKKKHLVLRYKQMLIAVGVHLPQPPMHNLTMKLAPTSWDVFIYYEYIGNAKQFCFFQFMYHDIKFYKLFVKLDA